MSPQTGAERTFASPTVVATDVAIIGAGPVGLMIANMLGLQGVNAIVIELHDVTAHLRLHLAADDPPPEPRRPGVPGTVAVPTEHTHAVANHVVGDLHSLEHAVRCAPIQSREWTRVGWAVFLGK